MSGGKTKRTRNNKLIDSWSLVHAVVSAGLALWLGPWVALVIATLWEPLEIFVLSPLLAKIGITFGYESLKNSLSDIVFNCLGILAAMIIP